MKLTMKLATVALAAALALTGCSVDQTEQAKAPDVDVAADSGNMPEYEVVQTEEGRAPSVDVDAEGGNLPEYEVDTAEVDVSTDTETVTVPKAKIVTEEETVEVPDVNVTMPDDNDNNPQ
jgi:hypothetical protein